MGDVSAEPPDPRSNDATEGEDRADNGSEDQWNDVNF